MEGQSGGKLLQNHQINEPCRTSRTRKTKASIRTGIVDHVLVRYQRCTAPKCPPFRPFRRVSSDGAETPVQMAVVDPKVVRSFPSRTGTFSWCGLSCATAPGQLPTRLRTPLPGRKAPDTKPFPTAQEHFDLCSLDLTPFKLEFPSNNIIHPIPPIVINISCHNQLHITNSKKSITLKTQTSSVVKATLVQTTRSPSINSTSIPSVGARSLSSGLSVCTLENVASRPSVPLPAQQAPETSANCHSDWYLFLQLQILAQASDTQSSYQSQ